MSLDEHLDLDELERLLRDEVPLPELYELVFHLLVCGICRQRLVQLHPEAGRKFLRRAFHSEAVHVGTPPPPEEGPRRELFEALRLDGLRDLAENLDAIDLIEEVSSMEVARRRLVVLNSPRFQTLAFVFALRGAMEERWHDDPAEALEYGELAQLVLDRLDLRQYRLPLVNDARAAVTAGIGNIRRIFGDWTAAEEEFERAEVFLEEGTTDLAEKATFLAHLSSLRRDQRRFEESFALLEVSAELFRSVRDSGGN